jgi:hypothetical protein
VFWPFTYYAFTSHTPREVIDSGEDYYKFEWLGVWDDSPGASWRNKARMALESRGFSLHMTDSEERLFLHYVAQDGKEEHVQFLLGRGADVAAVDKLGRTALYYAVKNGHETTVEILLDGGALPTAADHNGWTVLHEAASRGNALLVIVLIGRGENPRAKDKLGTTVLHAAVRSTEAEDVIAFLLGLDVEVDSADRYYNTPH